MSAASSSLEWQRGAIAPPHRPHYSSYDSPPRPYADSGTPREMRSPYGYSAPPPHVVSRGSAPPPHGPPHDYWYDGQPPSHRRPGGWYHRRHDSPPSYDHRPQMGPPPPPPPQSYYHSMSSRDRPYVPDMRPGRAPSMMEAPPPSSHPHSLQPRRVYGTPKRTESNSWSSSRGGAEAQDAQDNQDSRDSRHSKDMRDSARDRKNGDPLSLLAKVSSAMAHDGKKKNAGGNQEDEVEEETESLAPSSPDQRRGPRPTKVITPTGSTVQTVMARQISPMVDPRRHHEPYYESVERNPGPSTPHYPPPHYPPHYGNEWGQGADLSGPAVVERGSFDSHDVHPPLEHPHPPPPRYEHSTRGGGGPAPPPYYPYSNDHSVPSRPQPPHWVPPRKERLPPPIHGPPPPRWQQHHHDHQRPPYLPPPPSRHFDHRGGDDSPSPPSTPYKKHQHHGDSRYAPYTYVQQPHLEEKTVLRKKFSWKHYPELERFLIANRDEYLKHSSMNYTAEQKQYNNWLTEKLLEVASEHHYAFDPEDFNFVAIRDRIRCYYKSYVQTARKRGLSLPSKDAANIKGNKRLKRDSENDATVAEAIEKEATALEDTSREDVNADEDAGASTVATPADVDEGTNA